ncbi:MAG: acyltransferase [Verrucomicrobiota bacterium]|nr:acyltransferase [Verrucomicrobiota bacterium]
MGLNFSCGSNSKCINETGVRGKISISDNCEINGVLIAKERGQISIGKYTTIRYGTKVLSVNRIQIGNCVIISNNVTIYDNNTHPVDPEIREKMSRSGFYGDLWEPKHSSSAPIIIDDNVWIGERANILKGVKIGRGAIVGMASTVTSDVPEYSIVAGNPARIVKYLK